MDEDDLSFHQSFDSSKSPQARGTVSPLPSLLPCEFPIIENEGISDGGDDYDFDAEPSDPNSPGSVDV